MGILWESYGTSAQDSRFMWQRIFNFLPSLNTYDILSPDLKLRRRVTQGLQTRPALSLLDWQAAYGAPNHIDIAIAEFAFTQLPKYSGLDMAQLLPSDRLEEDLCWTGVCWYDWYLTLCDDIQLQFGVELNPYLEDLEVETLGELLQYLSQQITHTA
ncbi:hypothetical protein ACQ4M4_03375 [Leptolyngbya sp. AN02str]|uniref:hypothetical protein n=1 Tax=Leptolyngbya sp. AN02str TaxID=3423363 RepID=UPI003D3167A2